MRMSKERLEEIKTIHDKIIKESIDGDKRMVVGDLLSDLFAEQHTDWLIQQAEEKIILEQKVKDLEEQFSFSENFVDKKFQRLLKENQRYKQALEFYADKENYKTVLENEKEIVFLEMSKIQRGYGDVARKALEDDTQ
jgi:DNA integrity scanning protein DisA with diadenylate cyclase activity